MEYMQEGQIEISGFIECNTNWQHVGVGTSLNKSVHKVFENYSYNTAGINQGKTNPSRYQPGGT
jgi:hypothetical protein